MYSPRDCRLLSSCTRSDTDTAVGFARRDTSQQQNNTLIVNSPVDNSFLPATAGLMSLEGGPRATDVNKVEVKLKLKTVQNVKNHINLKDKHS